ncbi:hypothetical protein F9946_19000, partial [Burkholderia thailandensis]|nr:hypothetical protein [Burkholderia thailandensis]MDD1494727.1 hypothetical protein [Burkholderia thailandensis]
MVGCEEPVILVRSAFVQRFAGLSAAFSIKIGERAPGGTIWGAKKFTTPSCRVRRLCLQSRLFRAPENAARRGSGKFHSSGSAVGSGCDRERETVIQA